MDSSLTESFIKHYIREYDFWASLARNAEKKCRRLLSANSIPAIVSSRAKEPESLKAKIVKRALEKKYSSLEDIEADIVDLAGVRVALYFPSQVQKVVALLNDSFKLRDTKVHPQGDDRNTIGAYTATHLRVAFKQQDPTIHNRYTSDPIEIQVGSLLMHVWAHFNHDLVYKQLNGNPSDEEQRALSTIGKNIFITETSIDGLEEATAHRMKNMSKPFEHIGDLLQAIYRVAGIEQIGQRDTGPLQALMRYLRYTGANNVVGLRPLVQRWAKSPFQYAQNSLSISLLNFFIEERGSLDLSNPFYMSSSFPFQDDEHLSSWRSSSNAIRGAVILHVLAIACEELSFIDKQPLYPPARETLKQNGLLDSKTDSDDLEDKLSNPELGYLRFTVPIHELWDFFADQNNLHGQLGLGMALAKFEGGMLEGDEKGNTEV